MSYLHLQRPNVPENLRNVPTNTLTEWRTTLLSIKRNIESRLSSYGRESPDWRNRAVIALGCITNDAARIKREIQFRERGTQYRPNGKPPLYPYLQRLSNVLSSWKDAPADVRAAARDLGSVLEIHYRN